jgi:hypothetical protein
MKTVFTVVLALLLVGCGGINHDPVQREIALSSNGQPDKANMLNMLYDEDILKTPGDVGKMIAIMEFTCPLMAFPGATQVSPETVQRKFAQAWNINVTVKQARTLQAAQRDYCASR